MPSLHRVHRLAAFLLTLGAIGCGGGGTDPTTPPPPPPPAASVVTTVEITPAAPSVAAEDTVRLTATIKDQHGAVIGGKTASWTSSNQGVATVSADGLVTGVAQGQASITATVDGKQGTVPLAVTALVRIDLDAAAAKTGTIGAAGGTLSATAGNGMVYVLDVPAFALDAPVQISMTPVKQFKQLPFSGGSVGAVELAPVGLRFRRPATLRIKTTAAVPAGQILVAMYYASGGSQVLPGPAHQGAAEITLLVPEIGFILPSSGALRGSVGAAAPGSPSGAGAGAALATAQNLIPLFPPPTSPANLIAQVQLSSLSMPADQAGIEAVLRTWFRAVLAKIQGATTDVLLLDAIADFANWGSKLSELDLASKPLFQSLNPELRQGETELIIAFKRVMGVLNQDCVANRSLLAAGNIMQLWSLIYAVGALHMMEDPVLGLPENQVLAGLCVKIIVTDSTLPAPLLPNVPSQLDLRFGIQFGSDPNLTSSVPFAVELVKAGTTSDGTERAATNALGRYTSPVMATGQVSVVISGKACIDPSAVNGWLAHLCVTYLIDRPFGRTVTADVTVLTDAGLAQLADVGKIVGSLTIDGANITSTDLRELSLLTEVTKALRIQDAPTVTSLTGLRSLRTLGDLYLVRDPQLRSPQLPPRLTDLPVLEIAGMTIDDFSGFSGLSHIGILQIQQSQVANLTGLRRTFIDQGFGLGQVTGLTSLDGLNVSSTLGYLTLGGPDLVDLEALSGVTRVNELYLQLGGFPRVDGLRNLRQVDAVLAITPLAGGVDYTLPALQSVPILRIKLIAESCLGRSAPFTLGLPALQSLSVLDFQGTNTPAPTCFAGLPSTVSNLPLNNVFAGGGGLTSLSIKQVIGTTTAPGDFTAAGPDLTHVSVSGPLSVRTFRVIRNPLLTSASFGGPISVTGGTGSVPFQICNNATLASVTFGGPVRVTGNVVVAFNPLLNGTSAWPLTATGTVTITKAFNPLC